MTTDRDGLAAKAEALLAAHRPGDPLILVNTWDAWSARVVADAPGCLAVATASHSIAAARGYADGEQIPVAEMIEAIKLIASVVDLPVTADLEAGYGDVGATVGAAIEAGAVGGNLEDQLKPPDEHAQSVAAARAAGDAAGIHFVINARTDEYLLGAKNLDRAITAGCTYLEAGADCIFVPGAGTREDVAALVAAFDGRLSLIVSPKALPLPELAALGVARLSVGPGSLGMAAAALRDGAAQLLSRDAYPDTLAYRPPGA
ncbi:MAG: isocitrate lyase/phosphoenolpyruvate mutase family protein [Actinomycetota bacterium]|nr:isocitrate lyase/phosphoenolpyruvate mutase family protein [Actinomycetota bacterium]